METAIFDSQQHDVHNPNTWLALYLDCNNPIEENAKKALLRTGASWSRRFLFPLIMPISRLGIACVKMFRCVCPNWPNSSRLLHQSIYWGLKTFASRDANYLILRHFNIGTENLRFIGGNVPGVHICGTKALFPTTLEDLIDDTFLIHDLNLFNFVIEFNQQLAATGQELQPPTTLDFSMVSEEPFPIDYDALPNKWHNFLDLHSAVEMYTPFYAFWLTNDDFWRASNSLQLDQVIALYLSRLLNRPEIASLSNNRHPMIPAFILATAYRLMLHGHDAEVMHGLLRQHKRLQIK